MSYQPKPPGLEETARALLDPSAPVTDPALQLLQVAMSGFGYNFYDARNVARANDALVRGRASDALGKAGTALDRLQRQYLEIAFPGATRETPYPPPEVMRNVRLIEDVRKRALALGSAIAGAETPATDAIWFRFRDERTLLHALVAFDLGLATGGDSIASAALAIAPQHVDGESLTHLASAVTDLEITFAARRDLLRGKTSADGTSVVPKS